MFGASPDGFLDVPMRSVTFYDGATTPLTFELVFIDGNVSVSNLHKFLNEQVDLEGNGKHHGTVNGARIYPEIQISGKLDAFVSTTTSGGTLLDYWNAQTSTLYAAAVSPTPGVAKAGRTPLRHVVISYQQTSTISKRIAFEACAMSPAEFQDDEKGQINMSLRCLGRVFGDGALMCGEVGASTTVPAWVPAGT